jgi:hypothetical protein
VDAHDNILHFERVFKARLVDSLITAEMPMSPRDVDLADAAPEGRNVRINIVADKLIVEEDDVIASRAKPPPLLKARFSEVGYAPR